MELLGRVMRAPQSVEGGANAASERDRRRANRYAYGCPQAMAFDNGLGVPPDELFVKVHCRDLSNTGVALLLDEPPLGSNIILRFCIDGARFLVRAEIMHCRDVELDGWRGYLAGCQFGEEIKSRS